jgi:hypothetical protein
MTITALPAAPNPLIDDQATYNSKALAFTQALALFGTEANALADDVDDDAVAAAASASTASGHANTATVKAGEALASANAASASAATALNAPGTSATSTTSLTIGTGSKNLTIQAGKSIAVGASVIIAYTVTPTTRMSGTVMSYNEGTGALVVSVDATNGSGTQSAWTVSLGGVNADLSGYGALASENSWTAQQTFKELKDTVHTIVDGAAFEIDPANGSVQVVTLGDNRTPAATNFEAGQTVLLGIDDGSTFAITWTSVAPVWVKAGGTASAPSLAASGFTWVLLWKVSTTMYAAVVGSP